MTTSKSSMMSKCRSRESVFKALKKKKLSRLSAVDEDYLRKGDSPESVPGEQDDIGLDVDVDLFSDSSQGNESSFGTRSGSKVVSRPSSRASSLISGVLLRDPADELLPCPPLCGKCGSIKVTDTLPLKPDQLQVWKRTFTQGMKSTAGSRRGSASISPSRAGHVDLRRSLMCADPSSPTDSQPRSALSRKNTLVIPGLGPPEAGRPGARKLSAVRHSFRQNSCKDDQLKDLRLSLADTMQQRQEFTGPRKWTNKVESLKINTELPKSWFSDEPYSGPNQAVVLRRLTTRQVTLLEGWAVNHVKRVLLEVCAKIHAQMPKEGTRQREAIQSATICQLVRRSHDNNLTNEEFEFMLARLKHYPLLREFPPEFLRDVYRQLEVKEMVRGGEVFEADAVIDGLHILVQGEVELYKGESTDTIDAAMQIKEAPCVLQFNDLIAPHVSKPFLLRPEEQRVWTHTAVVRDDEDAASLAMFLFVPLSLIKSVAMDARKKESKELVDLIVRVFAPATRISDRICAKFSEIFELETHVRSHAILQQGVKPPLRGPPDEVAKLGMIIEGRVQLIRIEPGQSRKATKEVIGPGKLLGESAIYGEGYPHYALCISDLVKVLTVKVADYFQYLLSRPLERPAGAQQIDMSAAKEEASQSEQAAEDARRNSPSLLSFQQTAWRRKRDAKSLKAKEWKLVPHKAMLAWRPPPSARPHKSIGSSAKPSETIALADLNYPRDFDLFPSVQRSVMKSFTPDGSASCSTALPSGRITATQSTTFALCGNASVLASLDEKIRREAVQAEELETEHYLHAALGVYLEDAERPPSAAVQTVPRRSPQPPSSSPPLVKPPSRTAVLMTCGPLSARSQPARVAAPRVSVSSVAARK